MTLLSPEQMKRFVRAVSIRSQGSLDVGGLVVPIAEAKAFWASLAAAFPNGGDRGAVVSEFEAARFARFVSEVGGGAIVTRALKPMSRARMMALLVAAQRIAGWQQRYTARSNRLRGVSGTAIAVAATQLAACSTLFGGNIKGSWSCSAPNGSCAPSSVIDDQALSVIQNARPMTPAGPFMQMPTRARERAPAVAAAGRPVEVADNGLVHRDRRVLRVVFPSYVDGRGNVHEPRVVHTVVDRGGWMQVSEAGTTAADQVLGSAGAPAAPAAGPVRVGALDAPAMMPADLQNWSLSSPGRPAGIAASGVAVARADPAGEAAPKASDVEAARLRGVPPVNPLEDIRSRVQARLGGVSPLPAGAVQAAPKPPAPLPPGPSAAPAGVDAASAGAPAGPVNAPTSFPAKVEE